MSTAFYTRSGEHVATRFSAGKDKGLHLQLEVTPTEYENYKHKDVAAEGSDTFEPFHHLVSKHVTHFDTAARRNDAARNLETHRFKDQVPGMEDAASTLRIQAKAAAKDAVRAMFKG